MSTNLDALLDEVDAKLEKAIVKLERLRESVNNAEGRIVGHGKLLSAILDTLTELVPDVVVEAPQEDEISKIGIVTHPLELIEQLEPEMTEDEVIEEQSHYI